MKVIDTKALLITVKLLYTPEREINFLQGLGVRGLRLIQLHRKLIERINVYQRHKTFQKMGAFKPLNRFFYFGPRRNEITLQISEPVRYWASEERVYILQLFKTCNPGGLLMHAKPFLTGLILIPCLLFHLHCGPSADKTLVRRQGDANGNSNPTGCVPGVSKGGFGVCGIVLLKGFPQGYILGEGTDIEMLSDGKILVAGAVGDGTLESAVVLRLMESGTVDPTFGQSGALLVRPSTGLVTVRDTQAEGITILSSGKILMVGAYEHSWVANSPVKDYPFVARINGDGSLDRSFDFDGIMESPFYGAVGELIAAAPTAGGLYYAAGIRNNNPGTLNETTNAALVADPAIAGWVGQEKVGPVDGSASKIWVQSDGKVLLGGSNNNVATLTRFDSSGVLDSSFGTGGEAQISVPSGTSGSPRDGVVHEKSFVRMPDGRILLIADTENSSRKTVARLLPSLALDPTFGVGGKATWEWNKSATNNSSSTYSLSIRDATVQSDGKLVVVGARNSLAPVGRDIFVARFLENGGPDTSFGYQGVVITPLVDANRVARQSTASAVAIQTDGKILVTGEIFLGAATIIVLRYLSNGSLDEGK